MILAITVTGKDRPGIIAAVTGLIYAKGGNLEDVSMTILEDEFAMILLADFKTDLKLIGFQNEIKRMERKFMLTVSMDEIKRKLARGEKHDPGTIPYLVSVFGKDRSGIVFQMAKLLASHKLNITGLNSKITGMGKNSVYTLFLEFDMRKNLKLKVEKELRKLATQLKVEISAHPIDTIKM